MPNTTLFVMAPSHFCERARWGLDHKRIAYEERVWPPGLHEVFARRVKAKDTSVPILVSGDQTVQGSGAILTWAGLAGEDEDMERRFEDIGALVRQYIYSGTLHDTDSGIRELLLHGVPAAQAAVTRAGWPMIRRIMAKRMDTRQELRPQLERRIDVELDWVGRLVREDGTLATRGFGRAAITAASMLAPLAQPGAIPLYRRLRLPDDMTQAYARWAAGSALRWVNETYDKHRR